MGKTKKIQKKFPIFHSSRKCNFEEVFNFVVVLLILIFADVSIHKSSFIINSESIKLDL